MLVEFSFDVVQAASGAYVSDMYHELHRLPGREAGARARVPATYGLEMKDVFLTEDLAIGSYRHAISETIPEITRIAWRDKREEIQKLNPGRGRGEVRLQPLAPGIRARRTARTTRSPGLLARFLAFLYKLLPKIGPLRPLQFKAPTKEAEALFLESFKDTRERYRTALDALAPRAPRSAEHRLRHRQAERTRRILAGRRDLRRAAATA